MRKEKWERIKAVRLSPLGIRAHKPRTMFSENQIGLNKDHIYPNTHVTVRFKLVHMIVNILVRHCSHYACFNGVKTCSWVHQGPTLPLQQKGRVHISAWRTPQPWCYKRMCSPVTNMFCDISSLILKKFEFLNVVANLRIWNILSLILGLGFSNLYRILVIIISPCR